MGSIKQGWRGLWAPPRPETSGLRFLALALWISVAGGLWLEHAAIGRRALEARQTRIETDVRREWERNAGLERVAAGLVGDPAMIEREARRQGYGRPGENPYPLSANELRAARARLAPPADTDEFAWAATVGQAAAPAIMLLIIGVIAVLFFTDLKVDDHLPPRAPDPSGETP